MVKRPRAVLLLLVTLLFPVALAGQDSTWQAITPEGVVRASALVDSVFVEKQINRAAGGGGGNTGFIPPGGRLSDLPDEARSSLGPLVMFLKPETRLLAEIDLQTAGP